jgi:hypothetical protein
MTSSRKYFQDVFSDPLWIMMEVTINLKSYLSRFKNLSQYYRFLSQSEYTFRKETNRVFFNSTFSHGLYRKTIQGDKIKFIFFLKLITEKNKSQKTFELILRSKKLINSNVSILLPYQMSDTDKLLLNSKNGGNAYRKILKCRIDNKM